MMETDIEKMYFNLNELLEDICKFFSNEKLGVLSSKDKKLAESLISRCKTQLQEISKIQQLPTNEEYVDMDKNKDDNADTETTSIIEDGIICPYNDLPAKQASQEMKYGTISMRRKFLLGFEKMRRVYATIHNHWLIIYYCDRDVKPICTFDLKKYEAKETDSDKSTNFELIGSASPDRKTYYFMALTRKDMLQWVVHINRCHDIVVLRCKGIHLTEKRESMNEDDVSEHYDSIKPQSPVEEEEDDIYLELDDMATYNSQNNNTIISEKIPDEKSDPRPPLPGRRPLRRNMSIPIPPPVVKSLVLPPNDTRSSDESIASYDDIGSKEEVSQDSHNISLPSFEDSFSEDEEEATYEAFVNIRDKGDRLQNTFQRSKQIKTKGTTINNYDKSNPQGVPKIPELPIKPKVKDKPAVAKKPLVYSRSSNNS